MSVRLSKLAVFVVLALGSHFISVAYPESLIFPRFSFDSGTMTGLALANLSEEDTSVTLTAYATDGSLLIGPGFANPVVLDVQSGERIAMLITEIFGAALSPDRIGWVEIAAPVKGITGFFLFLDNRFTLFDGADLPEASDEVVFNTVRDGGGYRTEINLINPGNEHASVQLRLFRPGESPVESDLEMPARSVTRFDAGGWFFPEAIPEGSYLRARASGGRIAGFGFLRTEGADLLGLNAKPAKERLDNLYFPQMVVLEPWRSSLGMVNYTSKAVIATVRARKPDGTLYGPEFLNTNPVTLSLRGEESVLVDLAELFGFSGPAALDGWLEVNASDKAVNGYITYGIPERGSVAAIAASSRPLRNSVFSHIATAGGYFTGLALLNPSTLAIDTRILALDAAGSEIGSYDIVIQPGQRISKLINELIPDSDGRTSGMVWVSADLPLYASSLFGAENILANIPPQFAPESYQPADHLPRLRVTPPLAVVQPGRSQRFSVSGTGGAPRWTVNEIPGGNPVVGTIDGQGTFVAPANQPTPTFVTVAAEIGDRRGGASVDVLRKETLLGGLSLLQSIVYLQSLQRLYEVELLSTGFAAAGGTLEGFLQSHNESQLFQIAPPAVKVSARSFQDHMVKLATYRSEGGREFLLLLGRESGTVIRFDPNTSEARTVFTGLLEPTSMVVDDFTRSLLVAQRDDIVSVSAAVLEAGLPTAAQGSPGLDFQTSLIPAAGAGGLAVNPCTGEIYLSSGSEGSVSVFDRTTGQTRVLVAGLDNPGQMLILTRRGLPCPYSVQLLVAEEGADRISLIDLLRQTALPWFPAPGIKDMTFLPAGNPYNGVPSVAFGVTGEIAIVEVDDQYVPPRIPVVPEGECRDPIAFADPTLGQALQEALGLAHGAPVLCSALATLTEFSAPGRGITSLAGLQFASALKRMNVSRNFIEDLSPVAGLEALEELDASFNLVSTTGQMTNLGTLRTLNLAHNLLDDIGGLGESIVPLDYSPADRFPGSHSPALAELNLSFNNLSDLSVLSRFHSLRHLDVRFNPGLSDLESVRHLRLLEYLSAGNCSVTSLTPLSGLLELAVLLLPNNRIGNVAPLFLNPGIGPGDVIDLTGNPLEEACAELRELVRRGVSVRQDIACGADLGLVLSSPSVTAEPGGVLRLRAAVTNRGPRTADEVVLVGRLPAGTELRSALADGASCVSDGLEVTCTWIQIPAGTTAEAEFQLEVLATEGVLVATAAVSSEADDDMNLSDNQDSLSVRIADARLRITQAASGESAVTAETLTFTVVVENQGQDAVSSVQLVTTLSSGLEVLSFAINPGNCGRSGPSVECLVGDLGPGDSATLTVDALVTAVRGELSSLAVVTALRGGFDPVANSVRLATPVAGADISLVKTASAVLVSEGDSLTYRLEVFNAGPGRATNVRVVDVLPHGIEVTGVDPRRHCSAVSGVVECNLPELGAGENASFSIFTQVTASGEPLFNTAEATADQGDPRPADNRSSVDVRFALPDLRLTKRASSEAVMTGDSLVYRLEVHNGGEAAATNVRLRDALPPGLRFQRVEPATHCDLISGAVSCGFPRLEPGATIAVTIETSVTATRGAISNVAEVASDQPDSAPSDNLAEVTTDLLLPALTMTKTASGDVAGPGDPLDYTLRVDNLGEGAATNVRLTDTLPAGLAFLGVAPSDRCSLISGTVTCSFPRLAPGAAVVVTIQTRVTSTSGPIVNTAGVVSDQPDLNPSDNSDEVTTHPSGSDLTLTKSASSSSVSTGDPLTYTMVIRNHGGGNATGVRLSDPLPPGLRFSSVEPASRCGLSSGTVLCDFPQLGPGESVAVVLNTVVTATGGAISNVASVSSDQVDPTPAENLAGTTTEVALPDLALAKTASAGLVRTGDSLIYSIHVANAGLGRATNVRVDDPIPTGVGFSSVLPSDFCALVSDTVTCVFPRLDPGEDRVITVSTLVTATGGNLVNTAAASSDQPDANPADNHAEVVSVLAEADLELSVSASPDTVVAGGTVVYVPTVRNLGPQEASNVIILNTLPPGTTFLGFPASSAFCIATGGVSGREIACRLASISSGAESAATIAAAVNTLESALVNHARVSADQHDPNPDNNLATLSTPVSREVDLSVSMRADPVPVLPGGELSYTIRVANAGPSPASAVTLTDSLPTDLRFNSADPGSDCTYLADRHEVRCALGTLEAGEETEIVLSTTCSTAPSSPLLENRASVNSAEIEIAPDDNALTLQTPILQADLSVVLEDHPDPVIRESGETAGLGFTLTATVRNNGPGSATGVRLRASVGRPLGIVEAAPESGVCKITEELVSCQLGTLPPDAQLRVVIRVALAEDSEDGFHHSEVTVSARELDPVPENNRAIEETEVRTRF
jgi:uncharacterized repeat protein (TIGR01451 family)